MVATLHLLALLLYAGAAALFAGSLARGRAAPPVLSTALLILAVAAHGAGLVVYTGQHGDLPLVGLGPSFSALAFLLALSLLVVSTLKEARPLGLVVLPLTALLCLGAMLLGIRPAAEVIGFGGVWFAFHVIPSFVGYAALALAFAAGLLYLLQFRELKGKRLGRVYRFVPSLELLDRVGQGALVGGFAALTLGLLTGSAWIARFDASEGMTTKIVWGVLTWLVFVTALVARRRGMTGDRRGAAVTVVGFVLVIVVYLVLRLAVPSGRLFL